MNVRKSLTFDEKIKVLEMSNEGKSSRSIACTFNVGKTQVQNVLKRKHDILSSYNNRSGDKRFLVVPPMFQSGPGQWIHPSAVGPPPYTTNPAPPMEEEKQTRKTLSLYEKVKVVESSEEGKTGRIIAKEFSVGKTQVQKVLKNKDEVIATYEHIFPQYNTRNKNGESGSWIQPEEVDSQPSSSFCKLEKDYCNPLNENKKVTPVKKFLNESEKQQLLQMSACGKSARKIAIELNVGKTQVQNILKEHKGGTERKINGSNAKKKGEKDSIDADCWKWYLGMRILPAPHNRVSGEMIKSRAVELAAIKSSSFKVSNAWLYSFMRKHNIILGPDGYCVDDYVIAELRCHPPVPPEPQPMNAAIRTIEEANSQIQRIVDFSIWNGYAELRDALINAQDIISDLSNYQNHNLSGQQHQQQWFSSQPSEVR